MSFQSLFQRFHEAIRLRRPNENATLVEKRERVLARLNENLAVSFTPFNQGSYAMRTGIKPVSDDSDYDIDVAIVLDVNPRRDDPAQVKRLVYDAVYGHTTDVEWRRPCITVNYHRAGDIFCHVDLAVLAKDPYSNKLYLAIGKEQSPRDEREWQADDRKGFMEAIKNRFEDKDAEQFRRVIRYLKRWKDVHFSHEGRAAPSGLGLTVAAYHWFRPTRASYYSTEYDDLSATANLVLSIRQNFRQVVDPSLNRYVPRLSLQFPMDPRDDVFARMTNQQMLEFHQRLEKLSGWLEEARRMGDTTPLRKAFGKDFPAE